VSNIILDGLRQQVLLKSAAAAWYSTDSRIESVTNLHTAAQSGSDEHEKFGWIAGGGARNARWRTANSSDLVDWISTLLKVMKEPASP
jgi:hypothetical protein